MNTEDREFITELLKAQSDKNQTKNSKRNNYDLPDLAFKSLSTITMLLVVWIFSTVNDMQKSVSNIQIDNEYTKTSVQKISDFTEEPRFTKDDFTNRIEPLIKQINVNTAELNSRSSFIENTRETLTRLDLRVESLEKRK